MSQDQDAFAVLLEIRGQHIWCCTEDVSVLFKSALVHLADRSVRCPALEQRLEEELSSCLEW